MQPDVAKAPARTIETRRRLVARGVVDNVHPTGNPEGEYLIGDAGILLQIHEGQGGIAPLGIAGED